MTSSKHARSPARRRSANAGVERSSAIYLFEAIHSLDVAGFFRLSVRPLGNREFRRNRELAAVASIDDAGAARGEAAGVRGRPVSRVERRSPEPQIDRQLAPMMR